MAKKINTREAIRADYLASGCDRTTKAALGQKYGLTPMTVRAYLSGMIAAMDKEERPTKTTQKTAQVVTTLKLGVLSQSDIARLFNMSRQRVHTIHKKFLATAEE